MTVTPLYAAILGLIFVALSLQTIRLRRRHRVALGDGDQAPLRRAMRVHANFAEYVPLALLLMFFVERGGGSALRIHVLGIALLAGRLLHAWGVSQARENFRYRTTGMVLTFSVIISASLFLLFAQLA
ncbi:MAG: MAPEG family protein [Burkholderiales bacterium]|nr:MAPEG family protein [Burkholderiales bacterium]